MIITQKLIAGTPRILIAKCAGYSVTDTTSTTAVITETIPGGLLGPNGYLYWEGLMSSSTGDCRTGFVRINNTVVAQPGNSGTSTIRFHGMVKNLNNVAANVRGSNGLATGLNLGSSTGANSTTAFNTDADMTLVVQLQPSATTHIVTFEYFYLWVCYKP